MASFDGAAFVYLWNANSDDQTLEAEISVRHIPGSDDNYIDIGGRRPREVTIPIYLPTDAEYSGLLAKVGLQGTLSYGGKSYSAIMRSLRVTQAVIGSVNDRRGEASFVILSEI